MGQAFMTRRGGGGKKLPALTNPATAAQIFKGYQGIDSEGLPIEGAALATAISAATSNVVKGKTFYNEKGELKTGTLTPYYFNSTSHEISKSESGRAVTITLNTSGSEVVFAWAWEIESGYDFFVDVSYMEPVGTLVGTTSGGKLSCSGNTITLSIPKADSLQWSEWYIYAFSK